MAETPETDRSALLKKQARLKRWQEHGQCAEPGEISDLASERPEGKYDYSLTAP
jgi:hypothetical protein